VAWRNSAGTPASTAARWASAWGKTSCHLRATVGPSSTARATNRFDRSPTAAEGWLFRSTGTRGRRARCALDCRAFGGFGRTGAPGGRADTRRPNPARAAL